MESDFLKVLDGESLSFSQICNQEMQGSSYTSVQDMIDNSYLVPISEIVDSQDFWEPQDEPTYRRVPKFTWTAASALEEPPVPTKEEFSRMFSDWQHQIGSLQIPDGEVDFNDMAHMDMRPPRIAPEAIPDTLDVDLHAYPTSKYLEERILGLDTWNDNLNVFNLENFLENDDEEEQKFGLIVAEEEGLELKEVPLVEDENLKDVNEVDCKLENENTCGDTVQNEIPHVEDAVPVAVPEAIPMPVPEAIPEALPMPVPEALPMPVPEAISMPVPDAIPMPEVLPIPETLQMPVPEVVEGGQKTEAEDEAVDVETVVEEQITMIEAGDMNSLLEQFEAQEDLNTRSGNTVTNETNAVAVLDNSKVVCSSSSKANRNVPPPPTPPAADSSLHETIRDSLPKEVIDRIKASNQRKTIPLIPAMPSKRTGRGATRMQDAGATLNRNKLLKLVSGTVKRDSIQLDHDYSSNAPKSFYHSDASEYMTEKTLENRPAVKETDLSNKSKPSVDENKVYSRLPDYYVVLAPQNTLEKNKKLNSVKDELWDKNSRKDSGLESGDVSDASEVCASPGASDSLTCSPNPKFLDRTVYVKSVASLHGVDKMSGCIDMKSNKLEKKCASSIVRPADASKMISKGWSTSNPKHRSGTPVPMVSVLKKNNIGTGKQQSLLKPININNNNNNNCKNDIAQSLQTMAEAEKKTEGPKKKKLNLEEYRSRLKELDRSRSNNVNITMPSDLPVLDNTAPAQVDTAVSTSDTVQDTAVVAESASESAVPMETVAEKPVMRSVEVQTQTSPCDQEMEENASSERRSRKRQRKHYSERDSSSSSSHSSSASSSHSQRKSRSRRRKNSWRHQPRGHSGSSSDSRHPRTRSNSTHSSSSSSSSSSSGSQSGTGSYSCSSSSRSNSQSGSYSRSSRHSPDHGYSSQCHGYRRNYGYNSNWRSRSPGYRRSDWITEEEKQLQVEERRVIYVGRLAEGTSKAELRQRFEVFGRILDISVHFREHGDNYGFVTFAFKMDAYDAVEHGNDDPNLPRYDLCFGGRRAFCKTRYADLDGIATAGERGYSRGSSNVQHNRSNAQSGDFDLLLREAQAKLRKRKV